MYQTRYCAQEEFSIAVCTKESVRKLELQFDINNYGVSKQLGAFIKINYNSNIVASGTDLFVISQVWHNSTFEKYSNPVVIR